VKWKPINNQPAESSWVEASALYCFEKAISFIVSVLKKNDCEFRDVLVKTLSYMTARKELNEEFEKQMDETKFKLSDIAAEKLLAKTGEVTRLQSENDRVKLEHKAATRKFTTLEDKYNQLVIDHTLLSKVADDRANKIFSLSSDIQNLNRRNASLLTEYKSMCSYITDQKQAEEYVSQNPYGKLKIPTVRHFNN
jgi:chromosome segregation ATPase